MTYNVKDVQMSWRGLTLTDFGDDHTYNIEQDGDSFNPYKGVGGAGLNIVNNQRKYRITTSLKVDSPSLPILQQDNDNYVEGTLVVRDLNTGDSDVFTQCVIMSISGRKDSDTRTVTFSANYKNGK